MSATPDDTLEVVDAHDDTQYEAIDGLQEVGSSPSAGTRDGSTASWASFAEGWESEWQRARETEIERQIISEVGTALVFNLPRDTL
eukprot:6179420-Pleurochrysis_carterae.AAC.8